MLAYCLENVWASVSRCLLFIMRLQTDFVWMADLLHTLIQRATKFYSSLLLRGLSPRANYTDRATAACRRSWCQLLRIRGCHVVYLTDPYGRIFGFLDRSRYFFLQAAAQLYSRGRVDPVPDPLLLRKSGRAGNSHGNQDHILLS
jgi:hypothetical protein